MSWKITCVAGCTMCKRALSIYRKAKFHEHAFFVDKLHFVNEENDTTRFLVSERKMVFDFGSNYLTGENSRPRTHKFDTEENKMNIRDEQT